MSAFINFVQNHQEQFGFVFSERRSIVVLVKVSYNQ